MLFNGQPSFLLADSKAICQLNSLIRETSNGKLLGEADKFEAIDSQLTNLTQQVECLGTEIISAEQLDRKEYINQLKLLKYSVQSMERLYIKLLLATLGTAVFTVVGWCIILHRQPESNKSQHNPAAVAFTKPRLAQNRVSIASYDARTLIAVRCALRTLH